MLVEGSGLLTYQSYNQHIFSTTATKQMNLNISEFINPILPWSKSHICDLLGSIEPQELSVLHRNNNSI